ncbi:MAG: M24 family metallopeptidase [Candidatus Thorarchaeota archaeon]
MRPITDEKIANLCKFMESNAIDAIMIADWENGRDVNMRYLTGHPMDATVVITVGGEVCIVPWDLQLAEDHAVADVVLNFTDYPNRWIGGALDYINKTITKDAPVIGVSANIPYRYVMAIYEGIAQAKIFDNPTLITNKFSELRMTKSPQELDKLVEAAKIGNKTIEIIKKFAHEKNGTENDLSFEVMKYMRKIGAEDNAFPSLIANIDRSHMIHCHPPADNNLLSKQGLSLIDFGALYEGYSSDITVPMTFGKLTKEQERIRDTTIKAYHVAIETIELGIPLWKIQQAVTNIMEKEGYVMPHSLGHGLGLTVHDSPSVRPKPTDVNELKNWTEDVVEEGMVFTIEPGVYVKGLGGQRLENDVMIRNGKVEVYTKSTIIEVD